MVIKSYWNGKRSEIRFSCISITARMSSLSFSFGFFRNLSRISGFMHGSVIAKGMYLLYRYRSPARARTLMLNNTAGKLLLKNQEPAGGWKRSGTVISNTFSVDARYSQLRFANYSYISYLVKHHAKCWLSFVIPGVMTHSSSLAIFFRRKN